MTIVPPALRDRLRAFYERHARPLDLLFFTGGFVFDLFATQHGVDHPLIIAQQMLYLSIIGGILFVEVVREARPSLMHFPRWFERLWAYRSLLLHFCLGTLMNVYSIFFLMSASLSSSIAFVVLLFGAIIGNELNAVRQRGVDVKVAFYAICVFCFWSLLVPVLLARVNNVTFGIALAATLLTLGTFRHALGRLLPQRSIRRWMFVPSLTVCLFLFAFYMIGWIPPVPIAAKRLGIYHRVERQGGEFVLSYEHHPWWKFWQSGDEIFYAQPGDKVYAFVAIFSPARFDDTVTIRWFRHDEAAGWQEAQHFPMAIAGGRRGGFRGFTVKENYSPGDWRVSVELRDGREIARLSFTIVSTMANPSRVLITERY